MLASNYLNLMGSDMGMVAYLCKHLRGHGDDIISIYSHVHQECLKKMTVEEATPIFAMINCYAFSRDCPRNTQVHKRTILFTALMENDLSALENRYRKIREVLFEVGLGKEIAHLITNYEDMDTTLKKFMVYAALTSSSSHRYACDRVVDFLLNSPQCQDLYKVTKFVADLPGERLREEELTKKSSNIILHVRKPFDLICKRFS